MKIAILGGGLSGVILARLLQEKGHECHVLEAQEELGGLCRTKLIDEFVYDLAGGHMLYSEDDETLNYILSQTGKDNWVKKTCNARILYKDTLIKYPFESGLFDLPKDDLFECLMGYIEVNYERKYLHKSAPKNFYDWLLYKFGKGIANNFLIPFNQKRWNYNLKHINTQWVDAKIPSLPFESIIKASIGMSTEGCKHRLTYYYPEKGGFQQVVNLLAEPLEHIHLSTPVNDIEKRNDKWVINNIYEYDDVISTLALQELLHIIKNTPPFVTSTLDSLWYNGLATVFLGLNKPFDHSYSWLYLPYKEHGIADKVTFLSNMSENNAPKGSGSLVAEITYKAKTLPESSDVLIDSVINSLDKLNIIDKSDIVLSDSYFFKYAYPVYGLKYNELIQIINNYLNEVKLKRFGRFATHSYVNIDVLVDKAFEFIDKWY